MTINEFRRSLSNTNPPSDVVLILEALWHQANGNWDLAHTIAQSQKSPEGDWVHAFLHSDEGDLANAGYWYRRADKPVATGTIQEEWEQLVSALI